MSESEVRYLLIGADQDGFEDVLLEEKIWWWWEEVGRFSSTRNGLEVELVKKMEEVEELLFKHQQACEQLNKDIEEARAALGSKSGRTQSFKMEKDTVKKYRKLIERPETNKWRPLISNHTLKRYKVPVGGGSTRSSKRSKQHFSDIPNNSPELQEGFVSVLPGTSDEIAQSLVDSEGVSHYETIKTESGGKNKNPGEQRGPNESKADFKARMKKKHGNQ